MLGETSSIFSRAQPQRTCQCRRPQRELCDEMMLMLRLALGQQSPFAPLAHGATSVKEGVEDGLHFLTRLLLEFGDPSMGFAFIDQVASYVAEPPVAARLVPRLPLSGLAPCLQGLRIFLTSRRVIPRLRLVGLRPSLQGCSAVGARPAEEIMAITMLRQSHPTRRRRPSRWHTSLRNDSARSCRKTGSCTEGIVPQLCLKGLPPSLQGCSALGAVLDDEDELLQEIEHGSLRPSSTCSCREEVPGYVPPLYLAGLRPSLQGCSGLGAPPSEEVELNAISTSSISSSGIRLVPHLDLGGLRPSLQGCSSLGAPPSEEVSMYENSSTSRSAHRAQLWPASSVNSAWCSAHASSYQGNSTCRRRTRCRPVPQLSLVGLRVSLHGYTGLGAPPPEAVF